MSSWKNDYNSSNSQNDIMSWIVVVICLVSPLWPLGLFLLLRKIRFGKQRAGGGSGTQNAWGNTAWQQPVSNRPQQPRQAPQQPARPGQGQSPRQASGTYHGAVQTPLNARQAPQGRQSKNNRDRDGAADKKQMFGKGLAVIMTLSAILLGLAGVVLLSAGAGSAAVAGLNGSNLSMSIIGGFSLLGSLISAITRGFVVKRGRRFQKYAAVVGSRRVMAIDDIAKIVGEPPEKTQKYLQMMIDAGIFGPSAYIDNNLDSLVLSFEDAEEALKEKRGREETAASAGSDNPYVAVVNELHMLRTGTLDPNIYGKIQRIEDVTVKIFRLVEEKPEKAPQLRRFMNYYLPTTLKLLHSYNTLEKQGVAGENISAAKNDIARILDTLAEGFEQQLDKLFSSDKLDISADIDVLENLMRQDGLTDDGMMMRTSGGGGF